MIVVEHMKYNVMFDEYYLGIHDYRIIVVPLTTLNNYFYHIGEKPRLHN